MQLDLLAIGVHPDDIELSCAGTLLKHIADGRKVGLFDLTRGELGSRGTVATRDEEAENSRRLMGAAVRVNANMRDGFFQHTEENVRKIATVLRTYRPKIVLANATEDRHPDHGRAAKLIADACYYSGLRAIKTRDEAGREQEAWRPDAVYHYIQDYHQRPDFVVDVTDFFEQKMACVRAFKTQFHQGDEADEADLPSTPISGADFAKFLEARAREFGRPAGFELGEGFRVTRVMGVKDVFQLN